MTVVSLEDTGELRNLAEQLYRLEHDPRRPGPLDFVLAVAASTALLTLGVCLLILTVAPDRFPVERGRIVLTLAAAAMIVAPVLGAIFGLNRANRKRFDAAMEKMDRIRCGCDGMADRRRPLVEANGRAVSPSEYYKIYSDAMKDLGDLAPGDGTPAA